MASNQLQKAQHVDGAALAVITAAEIDRQVATAKQYPRDIAKCLTELRGLVTSSEEVAQECFYTLERKEKEKGTNKEIIKFIVGPSVRFAELLVYCWHNLRVATRIVEEGTEFLTAQGIAHDLERNNAVSTEVRRRITTSQGYRYGADMIGVTGAAAGSIAFRNAVFDLIPPAVWRPIYEAARVKAVGDTKTLKERLATAIAAFVKAGAVEAQIYPALGIKGKDELTDDHLITLRALWTRVRDKEIDAARIFHPDAAEERRRIGLLGDDDPVAGDQVQAGDGQAAAPQGGGPEASASAGVGATPDKAKNKPAEDPADPDGDKVDRELVERVEKEVAAIRGAGKSEPIKQARGALELIASPDTPGDPKTKKRARVLLDKFDLGPAQ